MADLSATNLNGTSAVSKRNYKLKHRESTTDTNRAALATGDNAG